MIYMQIFCKLNLYKTISHFVKKVGHQHVLLAKNKYSRKLLKPFVVQIGYKSVRFIPPYGHFLGIFTKCSCYLSSDPNHPVAFKKLLKERILRYNNAQFWVQIGRKILQMSLYLKSFLSSYLC